MSLQDQVFCVDETQAGTTLAAALRHFLQGESWKQVRKLIANRHILVNDEIWLDEARRLRVGDRVAYSARPHVQVDHADRIVLRHVDEHLVVVEKPAGINTVRHPAELDWVAGRRELSPTLDDLVMRQLGIRMPRHRHESKPRLRIVHRLDKETSGLVCFARTVEAERGLGRQFKQHSVVRRYLALVPGEVQAQTVRSELVRDRGDGRRGSSSQPTPGSKTAITHLEVAEKLPGHTLLSCRLETGRTHQIRIHLAELGHPVCGDKVYRLRQGGEAIPGRSGAPRLALHATELGFVHPVTGEALHWDMPWPPDLREFLDNLRAGRQP